MLQPPLPLTLLAGASPAPQDAAGASSPANALVRPQEAGARVVARGRGLTLSRDEIVPVLLDRFAMAAPGRDLLKLLMSSKVLDQIGREEGLTISDEVITRRWREIDQQVRAGGSEEGIEGEIAARGISPAEFRDYLRLQLLQEELTRRALGLSADAMVSPDMQEVWLGETLAKRGHRDLPPPWANGVVSECGDIQVTTAELGNELLSKLDDTDVRETAWHMLLLESLEKRMPDLSAEARLGVLKKELERRRLKAETQAARQGQGVSFEEILKARGTSLDALARDPSVAIAALTRLYVDRNEGEDGLKRTFHAERDYFEGRFGTALRTHAIFLIAGEFKNEFVTRTFQEADAEIGKLRDQIKSLEEFRAFATRYSEDPGSRAKSGELGWVPRSGPGFPVELASALFDYYDGLPADAKVLPAGGTMIGPVRFESGSALLHVSSIRPTPGWEEMRDIVHEELRRRLIEDLMPVDAIEVVIR